jgi:DNA-binding transcriptional LysR family regulator
VQGRIESKSGELLRDAAVAGLGIALYATWHVAEDIRRGRLVERLPDYPLATAGAVMLQRRLVPPRVRVLVKPFAGTLGNNAPSLGLSIN